MDSFIYHIILSGCGIVVALDAKLHPCHHGHHEARHCLQSPAARGLLVPLPHQDDPVLHPGLHRGHRPQVVLGYILVYMLVYCILCITVRDSNKGSRRFHNHGEGPYEDFLLVESTYNLQSLSHLIHY